MLLHKKAGVRTLLAMIAVGSSLAWSAEKLDPVGLAVYTDTARDIYVAGLLTPGGLPPADITSVSGPMAMEYRIATRRISSRGFSGTVLLQAELGSGHRAPEGVIDGLNELKQVIKGSMLNGDQFEIGLTADNHTVFRLNGSEMVRMEGGNAFQYLLSGWVGEGASALLRDPLLSGDIDADVQLRYESLMPLESRRQAVAAWTSEATPAEEPEPQVAVVPEPVAEPDTVPEPVIEPAEQVVAADPVEQAQDEVGAVALATTAVAALDTAAAVPSAAAPVADAAPSPSIDQAEVEVAEKVDLAEVEVPHERLAVAQNEGMVDAVAADEAQLLELDDIQYQKLLNEYMGQVMTKVFREVRYPRRAVSRSLEGQVELMAQIDDQGRLQELIMSSSSGHGLLDRAALEAVEEAAPFPELSLVARAEFRSDDEQSYQLMIPVTFRLQ